jgi:hypothetical protein
LGWATFTLQAKKKCAQGTRATDEKAKVAQRITQGTLASLAFELRAKGALPFAFHFISDANAKGAQGQPLLLAMQPLLLASASKGKRQRQKEAREATFAFGYATFAFG